jgi:Ca-activated chloride channel family protein
MKTIQDYYGVLGVSPEASLEDIKAAYRQAARRFHPDVNTNPGAVAQFRDIAEAYNILGTPSSRSDYDLTLTRVGLPPPFFGLRATPSKRVLRNLPEPQVLYVLTEIIPDMRFARDDTHISSLNLALIIDRSTSMKGPRLERVKQAAHRIIENMDSTDLLSVISFSDRAEVVFPATPVAERATLKAMSSTMQASGGTEIFQGLQAGVREVRRNLNPRYVNHVILLTDGQTYGDEDKCLALAEEVAKEGIGISTVGIGQEWNDVFLDDLASKTGGSSTYINSPSAIVPFLNKKVRSLGASFAERIAMSVAPDADVTLEYAFRLTPSPQPLPLNLQSIPLGSLEKNRPVSVILQLQMPALPDPQFRTALRLDVSGDVMHADYRGYKINSDLSIEVSKKGSAENPPLAILDALGKLTLYRMQEKAQEAISEGNVREATRRLQNLATRLLESGQKQLAHAAIAEAHRVARTTMLSEEGQKTLKYGTRALLMAPDDNDPGEDS